jgi:hypothetical protein
MRLFLAGRLPVTSKGAALNHRSQPLGRALMHDVPSAGPGGLRTGDNPRPGGCGRLRVPVWLRRTGDAQGAGLRDDFLTDNTTLDAVRWNAR